MAEERGQFQYATGRELVLKPERQKRLQQSRLRKSKAWTKGLSAEKEKEVYFLYLAEEDTYWGEYKGENN